MYQDRVYETSTSTGTGSFTLAGAATGYRTFSAAFGASAAYYVIVNRSNPAEWEVGSFTVSGATLARIAGNVLSGSAGAGTLVNFTAGTKDIYNTPPASKFAAWDSGSASNKVDKAGDTMTGNLIMSGTSKVRGSGSTAATTGFQISTGTDIGSLFAATSHGTHLSAIHGGFPAGSIPSFGYVTVDTSGRVTNCNCNCCSCFPAGSQVLLTDGTWKNIETLIPGDQLQGLFGRINTVMYLTTPKVGKRKVIQINNELISSADHLFWTENGWGCFDIELYRKIRWNSVESFEYRGQKIDRNEDIHPANLVVLGQESWISYKDTSIPITTLREVHLPEDELLYCPVLDGSQSFYINGGYIVDGIANSEFYQLQLNNQNHQLSL